MAKKTDVLIVLAEEKLIEVQKDFEKNTKQLEELITERGSLQANEVVGDITETDALKIKKLSAEIVRLKNELEVSTPLAIGLKGKILALKARKKKEEKLEAEKQQKLVEEKMAAISKEFIPVLKSAIEKNKELGKLYADWSGLSVRTGRMLFDQKIVQPSDGMLNLVCQTLLNEFSGKSDGQIRRFYSKDHFRETGVIF